MNVISPSLWIDVERLNSVACVASGYVIAIGRTIQRG